jgi:hypothetical protein
MNFRLLTVLVGVDPPQKVDFPKFEGENQEVWQQDCELLLKFIVCLMVRVLATRL